MTTTRSAVRILSVLLAALMSLTLALTAAPEARAYEPLNKSPFTDVKKTSPYFTAISWMYEENISTGWPDGTFRPQEPVYRDAMAAFIYRYKDEPEFLPPTRSPFIDISPDTLFYKEMTWLESERIATGYPDKTYRPWDATKRDAMAAFMYRLAGRPTYKAPTISPFTDVTPKAEFYKEMCWTVELGIATVVNGQFAPQSVVTRQMMASFMYGLAQADTP